MVELGIGLAVPVVLVGARYLLIEMTADRAPFAFNFLAVVIAAVLAGWRSGLVALVIGQLLTWYIVLDYPWSFAVPDNQRAWAIVVATLSQALILIIVALYQREVDRGVAEREGRLQLLEQARHEIDHRVRNNYQTVLALVRMQMQRVTDSGERELLQQVADRIRAVSMATDRLAMHSDDLQTIRLRAHLCALCAELERGLSRDDVSVRCEVADMTVNAVHATYLAIIVNELVTNALKHAFHDGRSGEIRVETKARVQGIELVVADNGAGMAEGRPSAGTGLGQKLVDTFVRHLDGEHEISSSETGTVHRIILPAF